MTKRRIIKAKETKYVTGYTIKTIWYAAIQNGDCNLPDMHMWKNQIKHAFMQIEYPDMQGFRRSLSDLYIYFSENSKAMSMKTIY